MPAPIPPRFRHLKRLTCLAFILTVLLTATWLTWRHRLARRLADARAAHPSSVTLADLRSGFPVAPTVNAPDLYLRGHRALSLTAAQRALIDSFPPPAPLIPAERALLSASVARNRAPLADFHAARSIPTRSWHVAVVSPVYATLLRHLNAAREVDTFLAAAALDAAAAGDDAECLARLHDALALADSLDTDPFIVCHLVADSTRTRTADALEHLLPTLRLTTPQARSAARALIAALLDERARSTALTRSFDVERFAADDAIAIFYSRAAILAPLADDQQARSDVRFAALANAASRPTYPAARAASPPPLPPRRGPAALADLPLSGINPATSRFMEIDFRARADRRLTATALAVRLYQSDHAAHLPQTLDDLVPTCLPAVPQDPFAPIPTPLHYLPARHPPCLYSVGLDAADNRATTQPLRPAPQPPSPRWSAPDAVLDLPDP